MCAPDLGPFLHQADFERLPSLGRELRQPTRSRKTRRPTADDHHIELHRLAGLFGHVTILP